MKIIWQVTITSKDCKNWLGQILGMDLEEIDWEDICNIYDEIYGWNIEVKFSTCFDLNGKNDEDFLYYLENYYIFDGIDKKEMIKELKIFKRQNKIESLLKA